MKPFNVPNSPFSSAFLALMLFGMFGPLLAQNTESSIDPPLAHSRLAVQQTQIELEDAISLLREEEEEAIPALERKIRRLWQQSGSPSRDLMLLRGIQAIEVGADREAVRQLSMLIEIAPDFTEAYHQRAIAFASRRYFGLAVNDLMLVLNKSPDHFDALALLIQLQIELGEIRHARQTFKQLTEIHPRAKILDELRQSLDYMRSQEAI